MKVKISVVAKAQRDRNGATWCLRAMSHADRQTVEWDRSEDVEENISAVTTVSYWNTFPSTVPEGHDVPMHKGKTGNELKINRNAGFQGENSQSTDSRRFWRKPTTSRLQQRSTREGREREELGSVAAHPPLQPGRRGIKVNRLMETLRREKRVQF